MASFLSPYRRNWTYERRISIRVDADVLDWLRTRHERYQVEINRLLRARMEAEASSRP
ncbi:BrnA antitoxin family protein [Acidisphaera sp. L21]|uniref:BrnA antitoxin family protein n=1 Tax=Acidisphaera sp. L21 TaxID=1641851 RepID=UPI00131E4B99